MTNKIKVKYRTTVYPDFEGPITKIIKELKDLQSKYGNEAELRAMYSSFDNSEYYCVVAERMETDQEYHTRINNLKKAKKKKAEKGEASKKKN